MSGLLMQIIATVTGAVILSFLGLNNVSHKVIVTGKSNTKRWKAVIVIGIIMIVGGISLLGNNIQNGGFQNSYVGLGFSIAFLGLILFWIGKAGHWWSKD